MQYYDLQLIHFMQAIYEAILLIPQSPSEATKILCRLARSQPLFLEYLKTMAVQLYDRFGPRSESQMSQYQVICKQLLAIFNRFVNVSFQEKGNDIYMIIERYYEWTLEILLCDHISLTSKKTLVSSFTQVINSICYQSGRMAELVDHMIKNSTKSASCVFIYLECLLASSVQQIKVIESIRQSYQFLYYVAISEYDELINFYKNQLMEADIGQIVPNSKFIQKLKENEYILFQLHKMFKIFEQIFQANKTYDGLVSLTAELFFHPDLAKYLSSLLKIEKDLFSNYERPNLYGLKLIVLTNLKTSEKNIINIQKSLCFSIIKIILSLTDKSFNLVCTDKLLMKELFNLSQLLINELLICSHEKVIQTLSVEIQITTLISSMFQLLSVIIHFQDLKYSFQSLDIEKLIRLTFFYSKTFEQQKTLYDSNPEEYFYFTYYICQNQKNQQEKIQLQSIQQFSVRRKSVEFIRSMNRKVEGFHNIIMDICCDIIKLQISLRTYNQMDYKLMFLEKYSLNQEIFNCFNLQSALSVFTILIQDSWDRHEKLKRMYYLLTNIKLNQLNNLELYRLYICLSINHELFILHQGHKVFYQFIDKIYSLECKQSSLTHAAYQFLQRLLSKKQIDNEKDYDCFLSKILNQFIPLFETSKCLFPFQTIQDAIKLPQVAKNVVCLNWINRSLAALNKRIISQINQSHEQVFKFMLSLYESLMKIAEKKIIENRSLPYPDFQNQYDQYFDQIARFVNRDKFRYFQKIFKQKESDEEDEVIIVNFSSILLQILIQEISLKNEQTDLILSFSIFLLSQSEKYEQNVKSVGFELLFQLVHIRIFTFDEKIHSTILAWMKQSYYRSEVCLSRVCIILQNLYYYIENNVNQNQTNFIYFYSSIIQTLQKKFLELLFQYHNYVEALEEEMDINVKMINELKIKFDQATKVKTNPITIIRLYNTILLNPYFDITTIRKIHQMIKKYNFQIVPAYDLTMQVLSLEALIKRSKNISVIECFRFTTQLLGYNCKNSGQRWRQETQEERQLALMVQRLRTSLTLIDPYEAYCILIDQYVFRPQQENCFISSRIDQIEIPIMNYLSNDKYLLNLVKKLTLIRNINNRTRMIVKIKKNDE